MRAKFQINIILSISITLFSSCSDTSIKQKEEDPKTTIYVDKKVKGSIDNTTLNSKEYKLNTGHTVLIKKNILFITDFEGKTIFDNESIIRLKDGSQRCISDGFLRIASKDEYFTVEQQNCSNKYLIGEYITFKYNQKSETFYLWKIGYTYIDKRNPQDSIPDKVFTPSEFGEIRFQDLNYFTLAVELAL